MATDAELDVLVAETIRALREKNETIGANIVVRDVHHNKARVLKAYSRFFEEERAKEEKENTSAISSTIGAEIIKDRKNCVDIMTESFKKRIDHLQSVTELLHEEIGSLQDEKAAMQQQAENDSDAINALHQINSQHVGQIQELRGQVEAKVVELSVERSNSAEIFTTVAALNQSLGEKKYEAHAEQKRASDLQAQLEELAKLLKEMEKSRDEARSTVGQLQENYTDLATRSEKTEKQLEDERKARLDAVAKHAEAKARAEVFEGQLAAMKKELADQPIVLAPVGREPEAAK